jgi:hypothetical protein
MLCAHRNFCLQDRCRDSGKARKASEESRQNSHGTEYEQRLVHGDIDMQECQLKKRELKQQQDARPVGSVDKKISIM